MADIETTIETYFDTKGKRVTLEGYWLINDAGEAVRHYDSAAEALDAIEHYGDAALFIEMPTIKVMGFTCRANHVNFGITLDINGGDSHWRVISIDLTSDSAYDIKTDNWTAVSILRAEVYGPLDDARVMAAALANRTEKGRICNGC